MPRHSLCLLSTSYITPQIPILCSNQTFPQRNPCSHTSLPFPLPKMHLLNSWVGLYPPFRFAAHPPPPPRSLSNASCPCLLREPMLAATTAPSRSITITGLSNPAAWHSWSVFWRLNAWTEQLFVSQWRLDQVTPKALKLGSYFFKWFHFNIFLMN